MKYIFPILFGFTFLTACYLSKDLHDDVQARKTMKEDLAEINKANYELFNVELWKDEALGIVRKKIQEFEFSPDVYEMLDREINGYLKTLYIQYIKSGELLDIILKQMEKSGSMNKVFMGIIQKNVNEQLKTLNLQGEIPGFTKQIVDEIRRNEPMFRTYLQQELLRMVIDEASDQYRDRREVIYSKYSLTALEETEEYLNAQITEYDTTISSEMKWVVLILGILILGLLLSQKIIGFTNLITGLTLTSILILVLGVTMPMIDIDARLNAFAFTLLDEPISFDEQVIFYQSKSIVEVTKTLWQGGTIDLKIVGVLVLLFSIIFPFFKLILSGLYLFIGRIRNSKLAQTIIFQLGKWSMADVFVVAMFMAYFGFYGLISTQLGAISNNQNGFAIDTINYSKLSPGALFFTAYTILSIFIGIMINRESQRLTEVEKSKELK